MEELNLTHVKITGNFDDRTRNMLMARDKFTKEYCDKKGWDSDPEKLTIKQIMEIRKQDGWKNPKIMGDE